MSDKRKYHDPGPDCRFFVWAWDAYDTIFFDQGHDVAIDRDGNEWTLEKVLHREPGNEWKELVLKSE